MNIESPFSGECEVNIVPAVADEVFPAGGIGSGFFCAPEPGIVGFGAGGFGTSVFVFERERNSTEQARSLFTYIAGEEEGADVLADAVVEIGVPALCLVSEGLPADEDVERGLAFEDSGEFGLEGAGGSEALGGAGFVGLGVVRLLLDPVAQVAIGQLLQGGVVELMVVDEGVEAIGAAVPEVPDKGTVVEEFGVLLEELATLPVFDGFGFAALEPDGGDEGAFVEGAKGGGKELPQACGGVLLAVERRKTDDAVFVGEGFQPVGAEGKAIGEAAAGLARPAVAEQAGNGHMEWLLGASRMAIEEPLGRVVAVRRG